MTPSHNPVVMKRCQKLSKVEFAIRLSVRFTGSMRLSGRMGTAKLRPFRFYTALRRGWFSLGGHHSFMPFVTESGQPLLRSPRAPSCRL